MREVEKIFTTFKGVQKMLMKRGKLVLQIDSLYFIVQIRVLNKIFKDDVMLDVLTNNSVMIDKVFNNKTNEDV